MAGLTAVAKQSVIAISVTTGGVSFICILADVISLEAVVTVLLVFVTVINKLNKVFLG